MPVLGLVGVAVASVVSDRIKEDEQASCLALIGLREPESLDNILQF